MLFLKLQKLLIRLNVKVFFKEEIKNSQLYMSKFYYFYLNLS